MKIFFIPFWLVFIPFWFLTAFTESCKCLGFESFLLVWAAQERFTSILGDLAAWLSLGRTDTDICLSLPWERAWGPNPVVSQENSLNQRKSLDLACPLPRGQLWICALFLSCGPPDHSEPWLQKICNGLHLIHCCGIVGKCWVKNCLAPWAALHVGFTWETCLHFNLNLQRYVALASRSLLPVRTALLCLCVCHEDLSPLQTTRAGDVACEEKAAQHRWTLELTPVTNTPPATAGRKTHRQTTQALLLLRRKLTWNCFASHYTRCMCRLPEEHLP